MGTSFGYKSNDLYADPDDLIREFDGVLANGGNLLLNIGPMADGTIPPDQAGRLLTLGRWFQAR